MSHAILPEKKRCKQCGVEKSLSEFYKHVNGKYGVRAKCIICQRAINKVNREPYKGQANARASTWYYENKERRIEANKIWVANNINKVRGYKARWSASEKGRSTICAYRISNRDRYLVHKRNSYRKHKAKWIAYSENRRALLL